VTIKRRLLPYTIAIVAAFNVGLAAEACTPAERQTAKNDITIAIDMAALACALTHSSNEPPILQTACALDEKAAEAIAHGKSIAAQANIADAGKD